MAEKRSSPAASPAPTTRGPRRGSARAPADRDRRSDARHARHSDSPRMVHRANRLRIDAWERPMKALIAILVLSIALPATAAEESDRLKDAATLIFAGRTTEARAKLREAQSAYRAAKDDPHDAIASPL